MAKSNKAVVDIVVTTAGRFDMLEKCLDAIYNTAVVPVTITIIDDNSPKDEKLRHKELFVYNEAKDRYNSVRGFTVKRFDTMNGFPAAANAGAKVGSSDLILFISDDVELQEKTLETLLNRMQETDIGICGAKLLFPLSSTSPNRPAGKVQHVGLALDIHANPVHPLVGWSADNPKCNKSRDCFAVTGACFVVRRKLFSKVGGFDLMYGKGTYEDVDLCMKVRQLGNRIYIDTDAVAYHYVGATVEKQQQGYSLQNNNMLYKAKWASTGMFVYDEWTYR